MHVGRGDGTRVVAEMVLDSQESVTKYLASSLVINEMTLTARPALPPDAELVFVRISELPILADDALLAVTKEYMRTTAGVLAEAKWFWILYHVKMESSMKLSETASTGTGAVYMYNCLPNRFVDIAAYMDTLVKVMLF
ncbi:hypothetical protein DFQ29_004668 [Apophysomyces sp. BC1021]|nr:hypothetical protein DFQ29_004668 [Apophysomyces sp. BC1021]